MSELTEQQIATIKDAAEILSSFDSWYEMPS